MFRKASKGVGRRNRIPKSETNNFVLEGMNKTEARSLTNNMGLNPAQLASVKSAINRMVSKEMCKITRNGSDIVVQVFRKGNDGFQIIEKIVPINGKASDVIQKAYNRSGQLVHYHRKK